MERKKRGLEKRETLFFRKKFSKRLESRSVAFSTLITLLGNFHIRKRGVGKGSWREEGLRSPPLTYGGKDLPPSPKSGGRTSREIDLVFPEREGGGGHGTKPTATATATGAG